MSDIFGKELKPNNSGCKIEEAIEMEVEHVLADGNCLFNSVTLALENTVDRPYETREKLAKFMLSDPVIFNKTLLFKEPNEYADWLTGSSKNWGGEPELKAFSLMYKCEFAVVIYANVEVLIFG